MTSAPPSRPCDALSADLSLDRTAADGALVHAQRALPPQSVAAAQRKCRLTATFAQPVQTCPRAPPARGAAPSYASDRRGHPNLSSSRRGERSDHLDDAAVAPARVVDAPAQNPTQKVTSTPTPTLTSTQNLTQTQTQTLTLTQNPTITPTPTMTHKLTPTLTLTQNPTQKLTQTPTPTQTSPLHGASTGAVVVAPVCRCRRSDGAQRFAATGDGAASRAYADARLRYALVVRVARVASVQHRVCFRLTVSDAETQQRWELDKTLEDMTRFVAHVQHVSLEHAPVKRPLWGAFRGLQRFRLPTVRFAFRGATLNAQRRVLFDAFLRQTAALVAPVPLGPRRLQAVLALQEFVDVQRHCGDRSRRPDTCICRTNDVMTSHLVASLFAASDHRVPRACESFVRALTQTYVDDKRAFLSKRTARTLLDTVASKMGDITREMLKDQVLLGQLAVARLERSESDYYEFLDEVKHAVCGFVQQRVLVALEDHVHEALHTLTDWDDELALKNKIKLLQTKPQSFFGVPAHIAAESGNDWEDARRELRRVNEYALPLDKLKCLARAAGAIFQTCGPSCSPSIDTMSSVSSLDELDIVLRPSMTTDEFISVHLFVLVMSNMSQLLITREFLRVMCDPQDINGELGYYLTTFEVAVSLLVNHSHAQQPMLL